MSKLAELHHPLLTNLVIQTLQDKQISTILQFLNAETEVIMKIARLNFKEVLTVKQCLLRKFSSTPYSGFDLYKLALKNAAIIPTGFEKLDELLNGGLVTGNLYEICGSPAVGKTSFLMKVVKNIVANTNQQVYYLDTKNDFSGIKMKELIGEEQLDRLRNILVCRCLTRNDLLNKLHEIKNSSENQLKLRLIIIDSLPSVLLNSNDYIANNGFINSLANLMRYIAIEQHVVFLVTNLITYFENSSTSTDNVENIACGRYWSSLPNMKIKMELIKDKNNRKLTILKSDIFINKNIDNTVI